MQSFSESLNSSYIITDRDEDERGYSFGFTGEGGLRYVATLQNRLSFGLDSITMVTLNFITYTKHGGTMGTNLGTLNAIKVYSTIGTELVQYLKTHSPDALYFSAFQPRTVSVYTKLAKKIAHACNGRAWENNDDLAFAVTFTGKGNAFYAGKWGWREIF